MSLSGGSAVHAIIQGNQIGSHKRKKEENECEGR